MYTYSPVQWLLLFYAYCLFGWCFESAYVSLLERRLVNRGFIRGPMLPLYGTGAVMILFVALPLKSEPISLFFSGVVAATILEYVTGWAMETLFKVKYWDYSAHRFQYKGRICLQSSIAWGVLSLLLVHFINPPIARLVTALPHLPALIVAVIVSALFAADLGYAFRTALDLAKVLEELTRLREQMGELREQLSETAQETKEKLVDAAQETRERLSDAATETRERLSDAAQETRERLSDAATETREWLTDTAAETREWLTDAAADRGARLQEKLDALADAYEKRVSTIGKTRRWLIRGNPGAVSEKFGEALSELKEKWNRKR